MQLEYHKLIFYIGLFNRMNSKIRLYFPNDLSAGKVLKLGKKTIALYKKCFKNSRRGQDITFQFDKWRMGGKNSESW